MTGVDLTEHAETAYDFGAIHLVHAEGHAVTGVEPGNRKKRNGIDHRRALTPAAPVPGPFRPISAGRDPVCCRPGSAPLRHRVEPGWVGNCVDGTESSKETA